MLPVAHSEADRSHRLDLDRIGTLREEGGAPQDVLISDLSRTGCRLRTDAQLPLDAMVGIGIPGIGTSYGRISRIDPPFYGCAFLIPIKDEDVRAALTADTVIEITFPPSSIAEPLPSVVQDSHDVLEHEAHNKKFSLRVRIAMIVGLSILLWVCIIHGARLLMSLLGLSI